MKNYKKAVSGCVPRLVAILGIEKSIELFPYLFI